MVSYDGKTIPRWRMAAILKIAISPYIGEKSSDFDDILYTAADFELDECHVIKNEKVALDSLRVRQKAFLVLLNFGCRKLLHFDALRQFSLVRVQFEPVSGHPATNIHDALLEQSGWRGDVFTAAMQVQLRVIGKRVLLLLLLLLLLLPLLTTTTTYYYYDWI